MGWRRGDYKVVRHKMQPGDVIAFGGKGHFSQIIKWSTRSSVSHVGVILQSKLMIGDVPQDGFLNQIIESTSLNGSSGVAIGRLTDRIATYPGQMWWLLLSDQTRGNLDTKECDGFFIHQDRKPYDMPQAVKSALDAMDEVPLLKQGHAQHGGLLALLLFGARGGRARDGRGYSERRGLGRHADRSLPVRHLQRRRSRAAER